MPVPLRAFREGSAARLATVPGGCRAEGSAERGRVVDRVTVGMRMRKVRKLLGEPHDRTTMADALAEAQSRGATVMWGGSAAALGRMQQREFWYYRDVPQPGSSTMITFQGTRVVDIRSEPDA